MQIDVLTPGPVPADARQVAVPMRDRVELAADLYLAGPGAHPVVVVRLPYDKDGEYCHMAEVARHATGRGYSVFVQDVRGKFRSGGATEFGVHELDDGHDTVAWVVDQPWCDGRVVAWGDSYFGLTTLAAAASGHPALRAVAPRLTGTLLSREVVHPGGFPDVEATARTLYHSSWYLDRDAYEWSVDWTARPLRAPFDAFFDQVGRRSTGYDTERAGTGVVFAGPSIERLLAAPPVPVLFTVGLFDNCAHYSWHDLRRLQADPAWAGSVWLRLDALDHENNHVDDGPAGVPFDAARVLDPALDFFDDVLGGGPAATPRVSYEVVHGPTLTSTSWPPEDTGPRQLWLARDDGGPALRDAPGPRAELSWRHDPEQLVPSAAPDPFARLVPYPDLAAVAVRPDVLHLPGEPVHEPLDLLGPARLDVALATTAVSTDLFTRLLDVAPDGTHALVAKTQVHLAGDRRPGPVQLDLLSLSHRLRAGHRLAVQLMSSDVPDYVPDPGDDSDPWEATTSLPSTQTVLLGEPGGSVLHLTVRPAR
ncbi:CocE/NonD family hydrolase [Geodermatophilaceae bacterium NBWT11]|nr:CocE/NonD family hydrolase [Geodermatophilaceae bacterium NBWT11]